jgi:putative peptidoglycan lipid II flippase
VVGGLTLLFIIFPAFWIELFFSGMSEEALDLTTKLFIWTGPATFFMVVSIALIGLHNVYENYRLSSFSTFLFNGMYLIIGVGMTPVLMEFSYAIGATFGAFVMFLLLVHYIRKQKLMPIKFSFRKMPETKRFLKLALPLIFGGATIQFYQIIQRVFAADLAGGAIASLNYASKMTQFPQAVLMTSVTTIIYPLLAKAAGERNFARLQSVYKQGFRLLTIILLPASFFIFFYAKDIITFIFEYGNFNQNSTNATYPLLQMFSLSILSLAMNTYVTRFFYALEKTILPVILNVISVFIINIFVLYLFIDSIGSLAIALGTFVSAVINMILLILFAQVKLGLVATNKRYIGKLILFTCMAIGILWGTSSVAVNFTLLALLIGGIITLLIVATGLKIVK